MGKLELNGKQYCIDYEEWKALHRFYGYKVMEENKYYTPLVEEFHVGFEYEIEGECPFNTCHSCYFYGIFCKIELSRNEIN